MKRWIAILPLAACVALGMLFAVRVHHDPHYTPVALVGKPMPDEALAPLARSTSLDRQEVVRKTTGTVATLSISRI